MFTRFTPRNAVLAAALGAVFADARPAQATFMLSTDFAIANGNPNGVWTYGYRDTLSSPFAPYSLSVSASSVIGWQFGPGRSFDGNPGVYQSSTTQLLGTVYFDAGVVIQHPGQDGSLSVSRFTSPTTGQFTLTFAFTQQDSSPGGTDVHVLLNGGNLYSGLPDPHLGPTFRTLALTLTAGDTLDFAVGTGGNGFFNDSTGVFATIAPDHPSATAPAPAGFGLALFGGTLVAAVGRYRRRAD